MLIERISGLMKISVFTLFPEMFHALNASLLGKAQEKNVLEIEIINFRDYSEDKHKKVDDTPFGGGVGMLLKPEPLINALEANLDYSKDNLEIILLSPQGKTFTQIEANHLAKKDHLAFVCGHYEGFDERIRSFVTAEYSIGDYVLTGGELPAMVMIDSISRLIRGVIKESASYEEDSFFKGLLEYPQYTKPRSFRNMDVPDILLSGHHANIKKWQKKEAIRRTLQRRPDLLQQYEFSKEEAKLYREVLEEEKE